ncbi:unnamed protein product [Adineta steineri]|uniref:Thioredoxin domain-containing protein n=1 Tax=Adineta steineri TaxID=433720 RepID=A0A815PY60_9BILA|nr:unnamed protein product [Adineta steineri]CAF1504799.1 unnamed protein product [Adineta steineri]CAF1526325.1 unnamed protein product [Adineta steineri]CAF3669408.1 unnamed protein product [Adineta steineri]CAF3901086.1 unnamed protein product [Adineta steineri]
MAGIARLVNGSVHNKAKEEINLNDRKYKGKIYGLYFGAKWCEPCRNFTTLLTELYQEFHREKKFKIIYISSDNDEESFNEYRKNMPWLAVDFKQQKLREDLSTKFDVTGLPKLVLIDGDTGKTICTNAREQILYLDTEGKNFPWKSTTKPSSKSSSK